jgi:hypothetical protein
VFFTRRQIFYLLISILWFTVKAFALDAVDIAINQLGKDYDWGKTGPDFFDCSGLIQYAYRQIGVELPRHSGDQAQVGDLVVGEFLRGDLLFFTTDNERPGVVTHVGIYEADNIMINAEWYGRGVKRADITSSFWSPRFLFARRILSPPELGPGFLSFILGDPGFPGDGVFIHASPSEVCFLPVGPCPMFRLAEPFSIGRAINEGFTVTVFTQPPASSSSVRLVVGSPVPGQDDPESCNFDLVASGDIPESTIFNGVDGIFRNYSADFLDRIVTNLNLFTAPGCNITADDVYVADIIIGIPGDSEPPLDTTLDAASILVGQNAVPQP